MHSIPMKLALSSLLFQRNMAFIHPLAYHSKPKNIYFHPATTLMSIQEYTPGQGFSPLKMSDESGNRHPSSSHKKKWDDFWSKSIKIEGSQTRRHIIMSSTFKKSIHALKEYAQKNNLKAELRSFYAGLLGEHYGKNLAEQSLPDLENLMFHTLHNLRFNIFIGCKTWNMGISDALAKIEETEKMTLQNIDNAATIDEVKDLMENWHHQNVHIQQLFKDAEYQSMRIEIETMIEEITHIHPQNRRLDDVKKDIKERITSIIDSLKVDLSQAKNDDIRKWQNGELPLLHGHLTELTENPNIDKARPIFKKALQTNQKGAHALGISLTQLEKGDTKTIHFFKDAITSDGT